MTRLTPLCLAASLLAAAAVPLVLPADADAGAAVRQEATTYNIDPVHTAVVFGLDWNGMSTFYGKFNETRGAITYGGTPDSLAVDVTILVPSIDSHNEQRDQHLLSPDYFDARKYPEIRFVSTGVTENDDGTMTLAGDLTFHGTTKPIEATVTRITTGEARGQRCGVDAEFTIKRSDFGMDQGVEEGALGDEVKLMVGLQSTVG